MQCANPVDEPPLEWESNVSVPICNEQFHLGEELPNLFKFDELEVVTADTITFSAESRDSTSYMHSEEAFLDMDYHVTIGVIPVSGAPVQDMTIPVPAVAGSFSVPVSIPLEKVNSIVFDDTTDNILRMEFTNTSSDPLTDLVFTLDGIGSTSVPSFAGGATEVLEFDLKGDSIGNRLTLNVAGINPENSAKIITGQTSVNGLKANRVTVSDDLIDFRRVYVNRYDLTDTIRVDYIDIGDGNFIYTITNHTGVGFNLECIHDHIWESTYCRQYGVERVGDLSTIATNEDSAHFNGGIPGVQVAAGPRTEATLQKVILSNSRLFPEWDEENRISVTNVKYTVSTDPKGAMVTLSADDSLLFTIKTTSFRFKEMAGTCVEEMAYEADTQKTAVNLPWKDTPRDSLRGRMRLEEVWADLELTPRVNEGSFIDTMRIRFVAIAPGFPDVRDSLSTDLTTLSNDSLYRRRIDVTRVANMFSDTIAVIVKTSIPEGSYVRIVNDPDWMEPTIIGKMTVGVETGIRLNAKADWTIVRMVNMGLGGRRFELDPALRYFRKMSRRTGTLETRMRNNSNINVSLLALAAPDQLMDALDSLSMNELSSLLADPEEAADRGYVNLFGASGVSIPGRDTTQEHRDTVVLDDSQVETLMAADSLNLRWCIRFREQDRDALLNSDYLDLKARIKVNGENNTDSLLIWK